MPSDERNGLGCRCLEILFNILYMFKCAIQLIRALLNPNVISRRFFHFQFSSSAVVPFSLIYVCFAVEISILHEKVLNMASLVQFKAGVLNLIDGVLKPDTRKGLIRVIRDEHDLLHFQWGERDAAGGMAEDAEIDQIVFPGEAEFQKVIGKLQAPYARQLALIATGHLEKGELTRGAVFARP